MFWYLYCSFNINIVSHTFVRPIVPVCQRASPVCCDIVLNIDDVCQRSQKARMSGELSLNINIKEPRWDQGTFMGRAKHFFKVTDPRTVLLSSDTLDEARVIVEDYR